MYRRVVISAQKITRFVDGAIFFNKHTQKSKLATLSSPPFSCCERFIYTVYDQSQAGALYKSLSEETCQEFSP